MSISTGFDLLHEGVRRWVWQQNWSALRDIQEIAIVPVLEAKSDVIISAATASGKTEAAFLPACSKLMDEPCASIGIIYVSPLKALINDQYRRLCSLCDILGLPLTPWHGDARRSEKNKQIQEPRGVILITPESLESLLINRMDWIQYAFHGLRYVIIDEFHAFLGSERGRQLQSMLHRLEFLLGKTVPRIALSATLNDLAQIAVELRPNNPIPCKTIESSTWHSDIKIQIRGYLEPRAQDVSTPKASELIADSLFKLLRGQSNLIFANSRAKTEEVAASLSDRCSKEGVPNEFFPHHGSLSKELREGLEKRLLENSYPTSAVCTMTLELGIDIGHVDSIAQLAAPYTVASLRQRLGRSGRRGRPSVLRMFIAENSIDGNSHVADKLRLEMFQCVAMINLLLKKWNEPADDRQYHFSTLLQQTLSIVASYGGVRANQLWQLLCRNGPFRNINQTTFAKLLQAWGKHELLSQTHDGLLMLGVLGERTVGHFSFYAAFSTPEEYCLEYAGKPLGSIPISFPVWVGQFLVFAGKRWEVLQVAEKEKRIALRPASAGKPPKFGGMGQMLHDAVRLEMFRLYSSEETPAFCDSAAASLLTEGRRHFCGLGLKSASMLQSEQTVHMLPWLGDRATNAIALMLRSAGLNSDCSYGVIDVQDANIAQCQQTIQNILAAPCPDECDLAAHVPNTIIEKWDEYMPTELRAMNYAAKSLDVAGAWHWMLHSGLIRK